MTYAEFLRAVIDQGIADASESYKNRDAHRRGAVAGFEACRDKTPEELLTLLTEAGHRRTRLVGTDDVDAFKYATCFWNEVHWTCNVVSAALQNMGHPPIITPTVRGHLKAAHILGIASLDGTVN